MYEGLPPIVSSRPQSSLSPKGRHPKSWNAREDVKEVPTNAFGEIKFTNAYGSNRLKPAKVRVKGGPYVLLCSVGRVVGGAR